MSHYSGLIFQFTFIETLTSEDTPVFFIYAIQPLLFTE